MNAAAEQHTRCRLYICAALRDMKAAPLSDMLSRYRHAAMLLCRRYAPPLASPPVVLIRLRFHALRLMHTPPLRRHAYGLHMARCCHYALRRC